MGIFGGGDPDKDLLMAVRKRLLSEIKGGGGHAGQMQKVVNNVYGTAPDEGSGGGGMMSHMAGAGSVPEGDDPYSYMVDIERENTDNGWKKKVHRYRQMKDQNSGIEDEKKK